MTCALCNNWLVEEKQHLPCDRSISQVIDSASIMVQIQCLDFTVRLHEINCRELGAEKRSVERKCPPPTIYGGLSDRFDLGET